MYACVYTLSPLTPVAQGTLMTCKIYGSVKMIPSHLSGLVTGNQYCELRGDQSLSSGCCYSLPGTGRLPNHSVINDACCP